MSEPLEFRTVGQLRAALADVPDDRAIIAQVVGADHSAWNMHAALVPLVRQGTIAALVLTHPTLLTLPREPFAAPPENGRPTYTELVEALRIFIAADEAVDREAERTANNPAGWSSGPVIRRAQAVATFRVLLSRIPKEV